MGSMPSLERGIAAPFPADPVGRAFRFIALLLTAAAPVRDSLQQ
jgi:hypothetical protein